MENPDQEEIDPIIMPLLKSLADRMKMPELQIWEKEPWNDGSPNPTEED